MPRENHHQTALDLWQVEGRFLHLIYSPRGAIEGILIEAKGIFTQFVMNTEALNCAFLHLTNRSLLVLEGTERQLSDDGGAVHTVYDLVRLVSVDGKLFEESSSDNGVAGTVVRFNYAKHGAPNGAVLDNGDFVHIRPHRFEAMKLKVGQHVHVEGPVSSMQCGLGRVIEAERINGAPLN